MDQQLGSSYIDVDKKEIHCACSCFSPFAITRHGFFEFKNSAHDDIYVELTALIIL